MKSTQGLLVTGFGPFGEHEANPSEQLARNCGAEFRILEVSFAAVDAFVSEVKHERRTALLLMGVSPRAKVFHLERRARNEVGWHPDVREVSLGPGPIVKRGREHGSTLWQRGDATACKGKYTDDAGTYLCNYVLYQALRGLPDVQIGFLHVPTFERLAFEEQLLRLQRLLERIQARS